ncbi:nucleotide-binding domain-containing protein [Thozetella sp. PMI_491]|nr:nucleotide-binding domain-containing protein [Thozetella sp. PMI_491]
MQEKSIVNTRPTVVVVGAGVIGLTSALALQASLSREEYGVLVVAREWPSQLNYSVDYASMWAGAHVRPIPATSPQLTREAAWLKRAVTVFAEQAEREPWLGVRQTPAIEHLAVPDASYRAQNASSFAAETGLSGYRQLAANELPEGIKLGLAYDSFCINAPLYCAGFLRKFLLHGGHILQRSLSSQWEAFSLQGWNTCLVVNATGVGFGDPLCFPTRGQIVLTRLDSVEETVTRQNADGTWSFVIPRSYAGGTIIGGTKEPHDWSTEPRPEITAKLLENAITQLGPKVLGLPSTCTTLGQELVMRDVVGRRPSREGGMRVEVERAEDPGSSRHRLHRSVVHAYGAGGRGYEISWGVAEEVARLVERELSTADVQVAPGQTEKAKL